MWSKDNSKADVYKEADLVLIINFNAANATIKKTKYITNNAIML